MKKSIRNSLITAILLIICGGIIFFIALCLADFDFSQFSTQKSVTQSLEINEPFSNINLKSSTEDIHLVQNNSEKCRIVYNTPEKIRYSVSVENGTLKITETNNRKWYDFIGIYVGKTEITLYLPKKDYLSLNIESNTGDISAPDCFAFKNIKIETDTGDVDCFSDISEKLDIDTDTGDISLKNTNPKIVELETDTGEIKVDSLKCESFSVKSDTGDIHLENFLCDGSADVKSNTGDVKLLKSDAGSFNIETSTGDVSGRLLSDKVFLTKTQTGDIDVPSSISGGECSVKTSTGDIKFKIEKNQ